MKRIVCVIFTITVIIVQLAYASKVLLPDEMQDAFNHIGEFRNIPNNSVDVMVFGSSHAWKGFDTKELTDAYGISAYNYGCNWQHINTTKYFIREALENQTPKYVIIEAYRPELIGGAVVGEVIYTEKMVNSKYKLEYLYSLFQRDYINYVSYLLPITSYHDSWTDINKSRYIEATKDYDFSQNRGYYRSEKVTPITIGDWKQYKQSEIDPGAIAILDDIIAYCHEKGIEVIFFMTPHCLEYRYFDAWEQYTESRNVKYINFFEVDGKYRIDEKIDFWDAHHLNANGAKKVADYFGDLFTGVDS